MKISPVRLQRLNPPKDDLRLAIKNADFIPRERLIVAISSKVVAIDEGKCLLLKDYVKDDLIHSEAELYLERNLVPGKQLIHTVKHHMLVGSAGIDESNSGDYFVLLPENPGQSAQKIWEFIKKEYGLNEIGVIILDSHSVPMRRGAVGISIASFGFKPIKDYRGQGDLFDRELKITITNLADGLAAAATVVIGEGAEQTPIATIEGVEGIEFLQNAYQPRNQDDSFFINPEDDLYKPFFSELPWKEGGVGKGSKNT